MRCNPKVTLLCYDPRNPLRYLEVRGTVVEMTESGALEHLDRLSELYRSVTVFWRLCPRRTQGQRDAGVMQNSPDA